MVNLTKWYVHMFVLNITDRTTWNKAMSIGTERAITPLAHMRLDQLPITLTSLPSFWVCHDIIFVSLHARVLHLLLLVTGVPSLDQYVQKHEDWATLISHAELIYDQYASVSVVRELRRKCKTSTGDKVTEGDMVFENAVLFLRDGLISCEFTDTVKGGDSGRVVLILKI